MMFFFCGERTFGIHFLCFHSFWSASAGCRTFRYEFFAGNKEENLKRENTQKLKTRRKR